MSMVFHCAVCGGETGRELMVIDRPDRFERSIGIGPEGYQRAWVACAACGAATNVLPPVSVDRLAALRSSYYEVDFAGSDIGEKYRRVMALPPERSDNAGRVARVAEFAERWHGPDKRPRVLDIGAGTGVFLSRLLERTGGAWRYLALEPDPKAAAHLRGLGLFPVVEAMYQGQPELAGFNLVTLNKVLEHVAEPVAFLRAVAGSLAPEDGLLYVEVPDLLTTRLRAPDDNILGALHCHLYDPLSLCHVARAAGLEVVHVERISEPSGKLSVYGFATLPGVLNRKGGSI